MPNALTTKKQRASKTKSWLKKALTLNVPIKVVFTKENPQDKKIIVIFLRDHDAEMVNGDSPWFDAPWQEFEVNGENKWCLVVEAEQQGQNYNIKPPKQPSQSQQDEDEEQEHEESDEDEESDQQSQRSGSSKQEGSQNEPVTEEEMEELKRELAKEHNLFEREPTKRQTDAVETTEVPKAKKGISRQIETRFGLNELCQCRACRNKREKKGGSL